MITEFAQNPEIARIMDVAGFDFIIVDTEHSSYGRDAVIDLARITRYLDITYLVRVPGHEYNFIAGMLDSGAEGVMIPRIESKEQIEKIIEASKYPPRGARGYGPRGVLTNYEQKSVAEWTERIDDEVMIILQIERKKAIEVIDDLLSVEGVDAALIGPNDLSISLGIPGKYRDPIFMDAVQRVIYSCEKNGKISGIHTRNMEDILFWRERGMRLLAYSSDVALIVSASQKSISEIRGI
jgi:2-keto-3-deoxy-L-rhamnonate aldolase RhmA